MYINRALEQTIRKYLSRREILAIVGPRQSGKTTLLRHIFASLKNAVFLSFEQRDILELFNNDIKGFVDLYVKKNKYVFIDEFQYAAEGGRQLKYIFDTYTTKFIISGSSVSELSIHGIQYLVGRVFILPLFPLSFEEYLSHKDPALFSLYHEGSHSAPVISRILPHFREFCVYGGYPRVVLSKNAEEKQMVLRNIYDTYFLKEVKEILNLPRDYELSRLLEALALQTGNMLNYHELSSLTGFAYKDLLRHLNILEKTFMCSRSRPYFTNRRVELAKVPKLFFLDNGFRNTVIKSYQPLLQRPDRGQLTENFVAAELVKKGYDLRYWRTKAKAEVDFVIEKEGSPVPIEVKSSLPAPQRTRSFQSFLAKYKPATALILSEQLWANSRGVSFRPLFMAGSVI